MECWSTVAYLNKFYTKCGNLRNYATDIVWGLFLAIPGSSHVCVCGGGLGARTWE